MQNARTINSGSIRECPSYLKVPSRSVRVANHCDCRKCTRSIACKRDVVKNGIGRLDKVQRTFVWSQAVDESSTGVLTDSGPLNYLRPEAIWTTQSFSGNMHSCINCTTCVAIITNISHANTDVSKPQRCCSTLPRRCFGIGWYVHWLPHLGKFITFMLARFCDLPRTINVMSRSSASHFYFQIRTVSTRNGQVPCSPRP